MDNGLFTPQDLEELSARGITPEAAAHQVEEIRKGFPYLEILASASLEQGILRVETSEEACYMDLWEEYLLSGKASVYKMVPASGAASRMFKMLYNFLEAPYTAPEKPEEERFFSHINQFAFYERLNEACLRNNWKSIPKLIAAGEYKAIVENLLLPKGLGYGSKPKALLLFHNYKEAPRTSAEEHLVEGALYARDREGMVRLHFTVSPEHRKDFEALVHSLQPVYEDLYGVRYDISFSEQLPSTDTLALTPDGELFRTDTGHLLFRPGGHGALIHNLGKLPTDVVFIKNIDNVVPDPYKGTTIMYKKFLGGVLIALRRQIFSYLTLLEKGKPSHAQIEEILGFLEGQLSITVPEDLDKEDSSTIKWIQGRLNRPIRVCGMVRNQGEPGGGPFIVREHDGSSSLQILESSQIDMEDAGQRAFFEAGGYFNPVDLVCSI
ncbi:MAG: DUF4301 family protein, partial [Porphyromonadaceae bacterium]|nr:DUF4301 family protein [Porphyromonadaceae bacterium]